MIKIETKPTEVPKPTETETEVTKPTETETEKPTDANADLKASVAEKKAKLEKLKLKEEQKKLDEELAKFETEVKDSNPPAPQDPEKREPFDYIASDVREQMKAEGRWKEKED